MNMPAAAKLHDKVKAALLPRNTCHGHNEMVGALEEVLNIHRPFYRAPETEAECANCYPVAEYPCREVAILVQWLL